LFWFSSISYFHIRLHLCLSGHSLKLCSIGLPSHHDRQLLARICTRKTKGIHPWESVPSPILSNYSRLRLPSLRPRKITFSKESFAQLACHVYIIVGFIARFLVVLEMKGIPIGRASPPHLPDSALFCIGFCYYLPFMFLSRGVLIFGWVLMVMLLWGRGEF